MFYLTRLQPSQLLTHFPTKLAPLQLTPLHATRRQVLDCVDCLFEPCEQLIAWIWWKTAFLCLTHCGIVKTVAIADEYEFPIMRPTIKSDARNSMIETCLKLCRVNYSSSLKFHNQLKSKCTSSTPIAARVSRACWGKLRKSFPRSSPCASFLQHSFDRISTACTPRCWRNMSQQPPPKGRGKTAGWASRWDPTIWNLSL